MEKHRLQKILHSLLVLTILTTSCETIDPIRLTKFSKLDSPALITSNSATVKGKLMDIGDEISAYGHCWSTTQIPSIDNFTIENAGSPLKQVEYTSTLVGLMPKTQYYVRAYAKSFENTIYSEEISFTTIDDLTVTTNAISAKTQTTAECGGEVISDAGSSVISRGVCWNTSTNPTIELATKTSNGSGIGAFTSSLSGLIANTTYYVRAFATNSIKTAYGNEIVFTTNPITTVIPTLTTTEISSKTQNSAMSGGNITSDGGASITSRGVCWSSSPNPTITLPTKTNDGSGIGSFSSTISGLTANTLYYVRAYATNSEGTAYGDEISFTTLQSSVLPSISTTDITNKTQTGATSGGNVTSDGGASVTARGVCWSIASSPTIALTTKTNDGAGLGSFSSSITGLTDNTTYYVRAYATNSAGTAYGNEISFTTLILPVLPTLTTTTITSITIVTAVSGGNITSDGNAAVTARGVCYGVSSGPTIVNLTTSNGLGTGQFSSTLIGLQANTTYYVRAYATNIAGTAYGNELSFTTAPSTLTDIDGNIYDAITIGTQIWMKENLKVTKYRNGNTIGTTTPATLSMSGLTEPKYQWAYDGNESNVGIYGRLYTWHAASDSRNICPTGWHLPSDNEWTILTTYLGGEALAGEKIKEAGFAHWVAPNTGANNSSGFTALPTGYRGTDGSFNALGYFGGWWSSTPVPSTSNVWSRSVAYELSQVTRIGYNTNQGYSVRCLRD